jgi:hypothetical protein
MREKITFSAVVAVLCIFLSGISWGAGVDGTFTYQGRLNFSGALAGGGYDIRFTLFDTNVGGTMLAGPLTNSAVAVNGGLFTTLVNFGPGVFTGAGNWLELAVRTNGSGAFTVLSPRQLLAAVPYSVFALTASNVSGTVTASQLTGLGNAAFADTNTMRVALAANGVSAAQSNVLAGLSVSTNWTLTLPAGTNFYFVSNAPDASYSGVYYFSRMTNDAAVYTNGVRFLFLYSGYPVLQATAGYGVNSLYDEYILGSLPSPFWEDSQTGQPVDITVYGWQTQLHFSSDIITGSGFNIGGKFTGNLVGNVTGNLTGDVTGTFTGLATNSSFYGNAGGATNITVHSTVFLNWWDEIDAISHSFGSMFVTNNFLGTNTIAFCQAVPPSLTNGFNPAVPWLYTNGLVCWLGRGNLKGTNVSFFIELTNRFAAAGHPVNLNMACSVPGISAYQSARGSANSSGGTDLYKFYPPYTNAANPPSYPYYAGIGSANTGLRKLVIVGPIGANDAGIAGIYHLTTYTNINLICQALRAAGDTVAVVTDPIPYNASTNGSVALALQLLQNDLMTRSDLAADLRIDLCAYSVSRGDTNNTAAWLGDQLHPSASTARAWADYIFASITNNFVTAQSQINSLLATNGSVAALTGTATFNTTGNAAIATNAPNGIALNTISLLISNATLNPLNGLTGIVSVANGVMTLTLGQTNQLTNIIAAGGSTNFLATDAAGREVAVAWNNVPHSWQQLFSAGSASVNVALPGNSIRYYHPLAGLTAGSGGTVEAIAAMQLSTPWTYATNLNLNWYSTTAVAATTNLQVWLVTNGVSASNAYCATLTGGFPAAKKSYALATGSLPLTGVTNISFAVWFGVAGNSPSANYQFTVTLVK